MFCYQCEQTDRSGSTPGCALARGTCGKDAVTADLQDLLIHAVTGIGQYGVLARSLGVTDDEASAFVLHAMFTTLTNVNFSATRLEAMVREAAGVRDRLRAAYEAAAAGHGLSPRRPGGPAAWTPAGDTDGLLAQAAAVGVTAGLADVGPQVTGLRALNLYGLKGVCAYAHHAHVLGQDSPEVFAAIESTLDYLAGEPTDVEELLATALRTGSLNLTVMQLLDAANTGRFGTPRPAAVRTSPVAGKAILVSGHDLGDLAAVLEATVGLGINVYTNGEVLPAHAYPEFASYPHLVGNYGGAWQDQQDDFARFPGPILMTSNCIIEPRPAYRQRIFTTGPVGWPGVRHLTHDDLGPLLAAAEALPGFTAADEPGQPTTITVGFAREAVLGVAGTVLDAVRSGALRHFFLVGGCDGPTPGRNYYTDLALAAPSDTVVLTLGCAKYRVNGHDFGDLGGIPRLLDIGQCNDTYSAIVIATALADALGCEVNDLPLTLVISWFEQKAAAVLLTLLALGLRNLKLGPSLPGYLTPELVQVLVDRFGVSLIGDPKADVAQALARTPA